jgi:hypothetical protein
MDTSTGLLINSIFACFLRALYHSFGANLVV